MNHKRRNAWSSDSNSRWHPLLRCWSILKGLGKALCRFSGCSALFFLCLYALGTFLKLLLVGMKSYCRRGCITGTRYLVQPNYHYTERIFWAICLFLSITAGLFVMWYYLNTYTDNIFRIVVEDRDINEPIQFPAIGVCEIADTNQNKEKLLQIYKNITSGYPLHADKVDEVLFTVLRKMIYPYPKKVFPLGALILNSSYSASYKDIFRKIDFEKLAKEVRGSCKDLFLEYNWREKKFDCCNYFREIKSTLGNCYLMNSMQTERGPYMNLTVTKHYEKPSLLFNFKKNVMVLLLNPTEEPGQLNDLSSDIYVLVQIKIGFTHRPMVTDAALFSYNLNVTKCYEGRERYMNWNKMIKFTYKYASYSSCLSDCMRYLQHNACGCISYLLNKGGVQYCDLEGYICLEHNDLLNFLSLEHLKNSPCAECMPACNYHMNIGVSADRKFIMGSTRSARFTLLKFPRKRLRRQAIRGDLDVLVSLGGIISLFIGISLIGMLEFLFVVVREMIRARI